MVPQDWHKEHWIKTVSREAFIEWCRVNQPQYSAEDAGLIYDSHVLPEPDKVQIPVAKAIPDPPKPKDPGGVFIDTSIDEG